MVRIVVQHPLVALRGAVVLLAVFVHQAEVHQGADEGGEAGGRPLVEFHGQLVVAAAVVFHGQAEQCAGVVVIDLDGPLVEGHHFAGISAQGGHGGGPLRQVLGRLLDGAGEAVQHGQGLGGLAGIAEGLGAGQRALAGVVARPLRRLVALQGLVVLLASDVAAAEVEVGHGPAVALLQDLDGPIAAAQQVEAGPQADHARRGGLFLRLQLRHRIAEDGVIGPVADDGRLHVADFLRAEGSVDQDCLPQVEFDALHHGGCSPYQGIRD